MWIERLEIVGFAAAQMERIEFDEHVLNLFEESTEQGRLLVPAIVIAALFGINQGDGFNGDERLRLDNFRAISDPATSFSVSLDFALHDRQLRLVRNLIDDKVTILDRLSNGADVTGEFVKDEAPSDLGEVITGLNYRHWIECCLLLSKRSRANNGFSSSTMVDFLKSVTDESSPILLEAQAVQIIDQTIANFPYKMISIKIDFLVDELERQKVEISKKLSGYSARRSAVMPLIARLREIGPSVGAAKMDRRAKEYFQACLRAAELDGQIMQSRSWRSRLDSMKREMHRLGSLQDFTIESQHQIEELWMRRHSHLSDYQALADHVVPRIIQYEEQEVASKRKWESLHDFTPEQAQAFAQMANNFRKMQQELHELESELAQKQEHLAHQKNIDLSKFERSRRIMQGLDSQDANDAKAYAALLIGFRSQVAESDRGKWRAERLIKEIEEQRQAKTEGKPLLKALKPSTLRQQELEGAVADLDRHTSKLNELKEKISGLEQRLALLASKAGVANGDLLVEHINDYNTAPSEVKDLGILQKRIDSRRQSMRRLTEDIEPYFKQSGREEQAITIESTMSLSQELKSCMNDLSRLEAAFEEAKHSRDQLEFLLSEVRNIEEILWQLFANAGLDNPGDIEASYTEFYSKVASYHHWRLLDEEINKLEAQFTLGEDFGDKIARMEQERRQTWDRIQFLVNHYPEIAELAPPRSEEEGEAQSAEEFAALIEEHDQLQAEVRAFYTQYASEYPALAEKLADIERELKRTKANQLSLELAKEKLDNLLSEDLGALEISSMQACDGVGEALPLIIDARCLGQTELELAIALKFLSTVLVKNRQIILLSTSRNFETNRVMQSTGLQPQSIRFCLRKPANVIQAHYF